MSRSTPAIITQGEIISNERFLHNKYIIISIKNLIIKYINKISMTINYLERHDTMEINLVAKFGALANSFLTKVYYSINQDSYSCSNFK